MSKLTTSTTVKTVTGKSAVHKRVEQIENERLMHQNRMKVATTDTGVSNGSLTARRKWVKKSNRLQQQGVEHLREYHQGSAKSLLVDDIEDFMNSELVYTQIEVVDLTINFNPQRVWDFCVGYVALAMARNADATPTVSIIIGNIGLYYLAAITLFYNIYQASLGSVPPIQKLSRTLLDLMHAVSPTIRNGMAYTAAWPATFEEMIAAPDAYFPPHAFQNPSVMIGPQTPVVDISGRYIIDQTAFGVPVSVIETEGIRAFEQIQRWVLSITNDDMLHDYTTEGEYTNNVAVFAQERGAASPPMIGVQQMILELGFSQKDTWLVALRFAAGDDIQARQGWNVRTIQVGTHYALYRVLQDANPGTEYPRQLLKPVDIGLVLSQLLGHFFGAEFNYGEIDLQKILPTGNLVPFCNFTPLATYGEWITYLVSVLSRRYFLSSALCTGTPMLDPDTILIGAGSSFVTNPSPVDNLLGPMALMEDLAALVLGYDHVLDLLNVTPLVSRGTVLIGDVFTPSDTSSTEGWFRALFPWLSDVSLLAGDYPQMGVLSSTNLPNAIDLVEGIGLTFISMTQGPMVEDAILKVSSIWSNLQGSIVISPLISGSDSKRHHTNAFHIFEAEEVPPEGWNLLAVSSVTRFMTVNPVSSKLIASYPTALFPVLVINGSELQPAFQAIYRLVASVLLTEDYISYRSQKFLEPSHHNAANAFAPSESEMVNTRRTYMGEGGGFIEEIFSDGRWVDTLSLVAEGLGSLISPKIGKMAQNVVKALGNGATTRGKRVGLLKSLPHEVFTPVLSGFATHDQLHAIGEQYEGVSGKVVLPQVKPRLRSTRSVPKKRR